MEIIYKVLYSNRRSISAQIKNSKVLIRCPFNTPHKVINQFVLSNEKWIAKNLNKPTIDIVIEHNIKIEIIGQEFLVEKTDKKTEISGNTLRVHNYSNEDKRVKSFIQLIKTLVYPYFKERLDIYTRMMDTSYLTFKTTSANKRWGSCTSQKIVHLSYQCGFLPHKLFDYIIVHELAHIKYMNHSKQFWEYLSMYIPNYKDIRKELKKYNIIYKL